MNFFHFQNFSIRYATRSDGFILKYTSVSSSDSAFGQNCIENLYLSNFSIRCSTRSDDLNIRHIGVSLSDSALGQNYIENHYLSNFFFAKFIKASKFSFMRASFLALDHFFICFSVSNAKLISVNSQ